MMCRTGVDLPVPGPREPVPDLVTGGGVDRCGAGPGREVGPVREPGDVADLDEQPSGAGGADALEVQQRGAGGLDQLAQFFVGGLLPLVDRLQVTDQFRGDPAAGLAGGIARTGLRE
jgi:hypothetical protein